MSISTAIPTRATLASLSKRLLTFPGLVIPSIYFVALLALSRLHTRFDEWGGVMQFFAGQELVAGRGYRGWASHFWPPMFSALIGLGGHLVSPFLAGKLISIVASTLLVAVTYALALQLTGDRRVALWSQAFLVLNPLYARESIGAHNHLLEPLFLVTGLWLSLEGARERAISKQALAGLLCGLAALARYTSYALLAVPCLVALRLHRERGRAAALAMAFWIGFAVVSLPWWYEDTRLNGSPLATWEALNVCSAVMTPEPHTLRSLWWCSEQPIDGVLGIARAYPIEYLRNMKRNIGQSIVDLATSTAILAPFVIPALFWAPFLAQPADWIVMFGTLAAYLGLVVQDHAEVRYLLAWIPLLTVMSVSLLITYLDRCAQRVPAFGRHHLAVGLMAALWLIGAWESKGAIVSDLRGEWSEMPIARVRQATKALRRHDPDLKNKTIMASDPAWAFYAGSRYLATPLGYGGTVEGLANYEGVSDRVRVYAPKYPADLSTFRAGYFVYTKPIRGDGLSRFSFLLDPSSDRIPSSFAPVYRSPEVVVYRIDWARAAVPRSEEPTVRPALWRTPDRGRKAAGRTRSRLGAMPRRARPARQIARAVDERDVRQRLREVPEQPPGPRVVLLGEQAHVVP